MTDATYRLCPLCRRAVATRTRERYCVNDGTRLLTRCEHCHAAITSPHAEYCPHCGKRYGPLPALSHPQESP